MKQHIKKIVKRNKILHLLVKKVQRFRLKYKKPILGKNNVINNKGVLLNVKYDIIGNDNSVEIMQGSILSDMKIYIRGNNHELKIGENCHYKGGEIWFEDDHCKIEIGRNTSIESAHLAVTEHKKCIFIGEDCMFSGEIVIRTGDSHSIIDKETRKRINSGQDIEIGNHVWIGERSIILKGVKIGNNSIIATNSIVTKSIPNYSIAAGIPAKVIKNNVDWIRERIFD